ncbi:hypothetical protein DFH05DRAFT_1526163 [Lentinula detonsa]|uniref:Uncharacterized protein n=1 Tax=Lentinula detonsa TaxID=2804962 RepID=A0A9W8TX94_9AGAR|nr:hypothetical protein DFH05DRAFT_1526163 [Lentinula detonsa]
MNYNYYPSPPPYGYVPQWYQQNGNLNGSESQNANGVVGNAQGGGMVAPSQIPQHTTEEIVALREETARLRTELDIRSRRQHSPPPRYSSYRDRVPYSNYGNRPRRENHERDYDRYYDRERHYERDNRGPPYDREYRDRERERGYERAYRYRGYDREAPRGAPAPPRSEQREGTQGTHTGNDRSLSSSSHAPVPSRSTTTRIENPPVISISLAASPHKPNASNTFDDPMYVTIEEKIAATSLLLYRPTDDLHEDCMWDSNTGACVLVGEAMRQITQRNGPVVLPPPAIDGSNTLIETNSESAVDAAEKLMDNANEPGNFNALWIARQLYWQAKRIIHLEEGLGYTSERSTLPSHLRAHLQLYVDRKVIWADKPNTQSFVGEPWDTERDPNKPHVPSLATPDLNDTVDKWALWLIVNATTKEHPGITWTQSGHVDLATVQTHLMLHRLIRGIFGTVDVYTEHVRAAKKNFVLHFIDIVAIPDLYGQKLSELEIVANSGEGIDFKPNSSIFEENSEVVKHLADCGVSVDDMAEGFAFGQQWIIDKTWELDPYSLELQRYRNLLKRSRARLQFTHVVPVDNRSWTLPEEWEMEDIVEHRRRKHVQNLYRNQRVLKRDAWRFTRSVPRVGNVGINSLNQLARGIDGMRI